LIFLTENNIDFLIRLLRTYSKEIMNANKPGQIIECKYKSKLYKGRVIPFITSIIREGKLNNKFTI
jgi:hypothetical protein